MKFHWARFNIIFALVLAAGVTGCQTAKNKLKKEDISTIRFYIESHAGMPGRTFVAKIGETFPIEMILKSDPFLSEANVLKAEAWDTTDGGVAIRLELDRIGRRTLELNAALLANQRVAVHSHFPAGHWVAISTVKDLGRDGVVLLYPNTTPEETDRLVKGLNLVAAELEKDRDKEDLVETPTNDDPTK